MGWHCKIPEIKTFREEFCTQQNWPSEVKDFCTPHAFLHLTPAFWDPISSWGASIRDACSRCVLVAEASNENVFISSLLKVSLLQQTHSSRMMVSSWNILSNMFVYDILCRKVCFQTPSITLGDTSVCLFWLLFSSTLWLWLCRVPVWCIQMCFYFYLLIF